MKQASQNQHIASKKPVVTDYLDYRQFMRDFFDYKKAQDQGFSHQSWSAKAGFKSRSFLRLVMLAKRSLSEESIPMVAKALELKKQETDFFVNLVSYNQSSQFQSREYFFNRIMKANVSQKVTPIRDSYRYLTNHLVPRLQALLAMQGFKKDEATLAKILLCGENKIRQACDTLQSMGMAEWDASQGEWKSQVVNFAIPDDLGNLALQIFHKKSLEEAVQAMALPKETRHYGSLILALSPRDYQEVLQQIDQFMDTLLIKYQDTSLSNKVLYQINNNLIPVSTTLIREDSRAQKGEALPDIINEEVNL
ncbi:MAG: TIGR02147 family protein [Pseudobdellovibrionaceae bacterium]